jgi:hypothetical protein
MAREAGELKCDCCLPHFDDGEEDEMGEFLVRFAALVATAEREACAKVCERLPETFKIAADEFDYQAEMPTAENYAAAIRTRSDE